MLRGHHHTVCKEHENLDLALPGFWPPFPPLLHAAFPTPGPASVAPPRAPACHHSTDPPRSCQGKLLFALSPVLTMAFLLSVFLFKSYLSLNIPRKCYFPQDPRTHHNHQDTVFAGLLAKYLSPQLESPMKVVASSCSSPYSFLYLPQCPAREFKKNFTMKSQSFQISPLNIHLPSATLSHSDQHTLKVF